MRYVEWAQANNGVQARVEQQWVTNTISSLSECIFFFDLLCLCCSPGTMPRRADVPQRPETVNDNLAAQKYDNYAFHEPKAVIMPQAKENRDAHLAATSMLDTYEQALATGKDSGTASDREADELTDNFDPLGLSDDWDSQTTLRQPPAWL